MIALLQKDLYVLWRQMKIYAVLLAVYALLPSPYLNIFGVVYGAIMPYTAMAYDERAKWEQLAAMMPYRDLDIVLSKYALGALFSGTAAVAAGVGQLVVHQFYQTESGEWFTPETAVIAFGMALTIMAVTLPVLFRFSVEKARVMMFVLIVVIAGGGGALAAIAEDAASGEIAFHLPFPFPFPAAAMFLLIGAVLTAISVPVSVRMYQRRKR